MNNIEIIGIGYCLQDKMQWYDSSHIATNSSVFYNPDFNVKKRGLKYKNVATKVALYAVEQALLCAGCTFKQGKINSKDIAVIVATTTGNLEDIGTQIEVINNKCSLDLSPMSGPNLSSNIIASTIAIWYNLYGFNLTISNGPNSSIDAIEIAVNILAEKRASKVIIVGCEILSRYTNKLIEYKSPANYKQGAIALVLENGIEHDKIYKQQNYQRLFIHVEDNTRIFNEDEIKMYIGKQNYKYLITPSCLIKKIEDNRIVDLESKVGYLDSTFGLIGILYSSKHLINGESSVLISGDSNYGYKYAKIERV